MPATSQEKVHQGNSGADTTTPDNPGRGRGRQLPPEEKAKREAEKRARFVKVATRRTRSAMKALDALANTANRNTYAYTEHEAAQILNAVGVKFDNLQHVFSSTKDSEPEFTL